ncbi:MAG: Mth938-like domain-containing protein [Acidimicrobiia bacterium]
MASSPIITADSWGRVEVDGVTYKDVKLWPGGARAWDWEETGTSHESGVDPRDVDELLEHGARIVLLSTGRTGRMRTPRALVEALGDEVRIVVLETSEAIARYNELAGAGSPVGALIHSTC